MSETGQITTAHPPKVCAYCTGLFSKPSTYSLAQWRRKKYCSNRCRARSVGDGTSLGKNGYVYMCFNGKKQRRSHAVMEHVLGRPLRPGEIVHHINGNPVDDRPDNLRVFACNSDHISAHWQEGTIRFIDGAPRRVREEWPS